jgi:hypothetical protein
VNNADFTPLSQFVTYAQKRFDLSWLAGAFTDSRPQPGIPSRAVWLSLILGEVVHIPKQVYAQLSGPELSGQLIGILWFTPIFNGPLLDDKTRCTLTFDWNKAVLNVPADIRSDFESARPTDAIYDLRTGRLTGTLLGTGRFGGSVGKNTFTVDWSWPVIPSDSKGIEGKFTFTVDSF